VTTSNPDLLGIRDSTSFSDRYLPDIFDKMLRSRCLKYTESDIPTPVVSRQCCQIPQFRKF